MDEKKLRVLGLRRGDILLAVALCAAVLLLFGGRALLTKPGTQAVLTTPAGERTLDLSADGSFSVEGKDGITVVIRVEQGAVRFESSGCPDQTCVHSGWLSDAGDAAACLPAGVALRVTGGEPPVDAIAG